MTRMSDVTKRATSWRMAAAGAALALAVPWCAAAQSQDDAVPGASARYRDAWFQKRIAPAFDPKFETPTHGPVLYEPNDTGPLYTPIPERRTYAHRARLGRASLVMCSGDLAPTRDQMPDVADWNDPHWPAEMFRVYFEPAGPAPVSAAPR